MNEKNTIRLIDGLHKIFGHTSFKSYEQKIATETIFAGNDNVLIRMPRGSGKSLCYQLPIALKENLFAVVFSPRVIYVKNQVEYLLSKKIPSLYWGTNKSVQIRVKREIKSDSPSIKLLYLTPHQRVIQKFQYISRNIKPGRLAYFVFDECHCLSKQSQDFRDDYQELHLLRQLFPETLFILLDSAISIQTKQEVYQALELQQPVEVLMPVNQVDVFHDVCFMETLVDPIKHLSEFLNKCLGLPVETLEENQNCGIIFCWNKNDAPSLSQVLLDLSIPAQLYHDALKIKFCFDFLGSWFMSRLNFVVVTPNFGARINQKLVRFVVHWGPPENVEKYYQLKRCAGHDGYQSYFRVYLSFHDIFPSCIDLPSIPHEQPTSEVMESLLQFRCRHSVFSKYFDHQNFVCKDFCDVCVNPKSVEKQLRFIELNPEIDRMSKLSEVENHPPNTSIAWKSDIPNLNCRPPAECLLKIIRKTLYKEKTNRTEPGTSQKNVQSTSTSVRGHECIGESADDILTKVKLLLYEPKEEPSSPILFSSEEVDCENVHVETFNPNPDVFSQGFHLRYRGNSRVILKKIQSALYKCKD